MADKEVKKVKQPGAQKRLAQSIKRCFRNRTTKSRAKTAIRSWNEASVKGSEPKLVTDNLNAVFSCVDKAVKKGVFHKNKGARIKARLVRKSSARAK